MFFNKLFNSCSLSCCLSLSQHFAQQLFLFCIWFLLLCNPVDWYKIFSLCNNFASGFSFHCAATGCPDVDLEVLATGCTVACDWYIILLLDAYQQLVYCSLRLDVLLIASGCTSYLLVSLESCTCWFLAQNHLLNLSAKAKRCRINLFKRHRFAIANSKYHLLVNSSLRLDTSSSLTLLFTTTDCDDITTDVIIADSRFLLVLCLDPTTDSSSCLLIMLMSLLMSSLLIQRLILLTSSSLIQLLRFLSSADLYALALLLVFLHLLIMMSSPMTSSSMVHLDVPAGSSSSSSACSWFLSFQLIHFAPAGSTWPPPDYEQLTQLWTSPLLIQLPYTMMN
ncbi:hypothetical protein F511_10812 [Dorcoceras hygrometricum]|uniref:Uncharacterized protein n=1 Tax=Dorcoceras hygrometricum TaxID=472368 RepID=A0A2Z7BFH3_9LAMI|nr:hypothetical protein F511_10812 [Dorcoceras hygrometricum]